MDTSPTTLSVEGVQSAARNEFLRQFYLELARRLCPAPEHPESENAWLWKLHATTRRMVRLLSALSSRTAGDQMAPIQRACSFYLMEDGIARKERMQVFTALGAWSELFACAAVLRPSVNQLQQEYVRRARELETILCGASAEIPRGEPEGE